MNSKINEIKLDKTQIQASSDNLKLSVMWSKPAESTQVRGILQLVHGMCEHKERYQAFMEFMSSNGWICIIHDHRGHGESIHYPNELGYFYTGGYEAMVEDVKIVQDWAKTKFPDLPVCLLGHSMGSMVVRCFLKKYDNQIQKLIVCGSPSNNPAAGIGIKLCHYFIHNYGDMSRPKLLQKMSFGSFNNKFRKESSPNAWVCSNPEVLKTYDNDPLCQFQFTANGFENLLKLMRSIYSKEGWDLNHPQLPIHFVSGEQDPCIGSQKKFNQAVELIRNIGYQNVTSHLYPKMRHEILNESDKQVVWNDLAEFLAK